MSDCINATTRPMGDGYHRAVLAGRKHRAHRLAYIAAYGEPPSGWHIHHTCQNRSCVNPDHLVALSPGDHKREHARLRTHCRNGHEFSPENTLQTRTGRVCRTCDRATRNLRRARKRHSARA